MLSMWKKFSTVSLATIVFTGLSHSSLIQAQEPNPTSVAPGARSAQVIAEGPNGIYVYHVKVVEHDLDAVNYKNRSGSTHVGFQGTELMSGAHGDAKVSSVTGKTNIEVHLEGMTAANGFGSEYLTYVLWAISADGRPQNLGELELAGGKASLNVTTQFQAFGMIVTAEPYFAVAEPSDVIVLKNVFSDRTQGVLENVNVHYQLLPRGLYADTQGAHTVDHPITDREHYPLALFEAHNAARIAKEAGADKYAPDIMQEVSTDLLNADQMQSGGHRDVHEIFTFAREATERAEDARITTLRKEASERDRANVDAKNAAQADAANAQAAADASAAAKAQADAERARAEAEAADARAKAAEAQHNAEKSEQDASAVREKLRSQLNAVLATTENARGLIVNMNDVLFDTAKYSLKPGTQVSLAKVATILELYPGLKVQVEGYTDAVGGDDYNMKLSQNRAGAVHDFLVQNGVPATNVSAEGYGKADPVADNSTATGRAQNRRVNLVVSGDAIGVQTKAPSGN